MLVQCIRILLLLNTVEIFTLRKIVASVEAAPRSKGEAILTRVKSVRPWKESTRLNELQTSQNHRRVPKGM